MGNLRLTDAATKGIYLLRTSLDRFVAQRVKIDGSLHFRNNCIAKSGIDLIGASVEGNFTCSGSSIGEQNGIAMDCSSAKFGRNVYLNEGFEALGETKFRNSKIAGRLVCDKARFWSSEEYSLNLSDAVIGGDVSLSDEFVAVGGVNLMSAQISGQLVVSGAQIHPSYSLVERALPSVRPDYVLDLEAAHVGQDVFLRSGLEAYGPVNLWGAKISGDLRVEGISIKSGYNTALNLRSVCIGAEFLISKDNQIDGDIDLRQAEARILSDDPRMQLKGHFWLDGFSYSRLHDCPTDAETRIAWLNRQPPDHLDASFRPQPWSQLIKVFREIGHDEDARIVGIAREDVIAARSSTTMLRRLWAGFLRASVGHGYRPWRAMVFSVAFVAAGSVTFWIADVTGHMVPKNGAVLVNTVVRPEIGIPPGYPEFNAFVYALDVYLPVVELGQNEAWEASPAKKRGFAEPKFQNMLAKFFFARFDVLFEEGLLRIIYWAELLLGWVYISLFIAGMSGTMKNE